MDYRLLNDEEKKIHKAGALFYKKTFFIDNKLIDSNLRSMKKIKSIEEI